MYDVFTYFSFTQNIMNNSRFVRIKPNAMPSTIQQEQQIEFVDVL